MITFKRSFRSIYMVRFLIFLWLPSNEDLNMKAKKRENLLVYRENLPSIIFY